MATLSFLRTNERPKLQIDCVISDSNQLPDSAERGNRTFINFYNQQNYAKTIWHD